MLLIDVAALVPLLVRVAYGDDASPEGEFSPTGWQAFGVLEATTALRLLRLARSCLQPQ